MSNETLFGVDTELLKTYLFALVVVLVGILFSLGGGQETKTKSVSTKKVGAPEGTKTENKVEEPKKLTLKQLKAQLRREQRERAEKRAKQLERESPKKKAGML